MTNVLFTNVRIIDATGAQPYQGELLVQGNRIARVGRGTRSLPTAGVTVIDGAGATLMPGMCEAHTHFGWTNSKTLDAIQKMPHEEHTLWAAQVAKLYLDHGWTSCVGAATPKPRLDCVIRDAINAGQIPGPRYLAASQEITVTGSLGDDMLPHLPFPEMSFGCVVDGPEGMRKAVRMFLKYGVDQVKLNLSGDNLVPGADARTSWMSDEEVAVAAREVKVRGKRLATHARSSESVKQSMRHGVDQVKLNLSGDNLVPGADAHTSWMSDEEVAVAAREVKVRGKRLATHARSSESVKQSMRHGVEVIYHASFADEEALDMMEAQKDRIFVAPGLSVIIRLLNEGEVVGVTNAIAKDMGYELELEAAVKSMKAMLRRGIRVLPGGDYGFAWAPHGENAKDLEYFVKYLGMTPMEALISATRWGGQIMMCKDLGEIREGWLADLLLVDGDPLANISILQDKSKLLAIMKDGQFAKPPEIRSSRSRFVA
jgi:imidazolonepropionase-like amidohydrolase